MGYVRIVNIVFDEKVSSISKPFVLQIQFECLKALREGSAEINGLELEWEFVFVGNSHDAKYDQVLDTITMEEAELGVNEFTWEVRQRV